jgi:hypothetical protein
MRNVRTNTWSARRGESRGAHRIKPSRRPRQYRSGGIPLRAEHSILHRSVDESPTARCRTSIRRLGARPHPALVVALRRCSSVTWPCAERESCGRPGRAAADRTGKGRFQRTALSTACADDRGQRGRCIGMRLLIGGGVVNGARAVDNRAPNSLTCGRTSRQARWDTTCSVRLAASSCRLVPLPLVHDL